MAADFGRQLEVLKEVMSARRYEMTSFEADIWIRIIESVSQERFLAFLQHHYMTSPFAPQPSDATRYLDVASNPDVAFARLQRLVSSVGPYQSPVDVDPVMTATIQNLGGWVTVNEQLPDPSDSYGVKAYRERFNAAFNSATAQVRIDGQMPTEPLRGISHARVVAPALTNNPSEFLVLDSPKTAQRPKL